MGFLDGLTRTYHVSCQINTQMYAHLNSINHNYFGVKKKSTYAAKISKKDIFNNEYKYLIIVI